MPILGQDWFSPAQDWGKPIRGLGEPIRGMVLGWPGFLVHPPLLHDFCKTFATLLSDLHDFCLILARLSPDPAGQSAVSPKTIYPTAAWR